MIRAIIFDCFGVLAGSGFNETYRQAGGNLEADMKFVKNILREASSGTISSHDFMTKIADKIGITTDEWQTVVNEAEKPNLELFEYIKQLKSKYKIGLLSNANHGVMQRKFSPEQLSLFDDVVVSAEVGLIKPYPEIYELAAKRLSVRPDECIFIDDSPTQVGGAMATGMQAIQYVNLEQMKTDLRKLLWLFSPIIDNQSQRV